MFYILMVVVTSRVTWRCPTPMGGGGVTVWYISDWCYSWVCCHHNFTPFTLFLQYCAPVIDQNCSYTHLFPVWRVADGSIEQQWLAHYMTWNALSHLFSQHGSVQTLIINHSLEMKWISNIASPSILLHSHQKIGFNNEQTKNKISKTAWGRDRIVGRRYLAIAEI